MVVSSDGGLVVGAVMVMVAEFVDAEADGTADSNGDGDDDGDGDGDEDDVASAAATGAPTPWCGPPGASDAAAKELSPLAPSSRKAKSLEVESEPVRSAPRLTKSSCSSASFSSRSSPRRME